MFVPCPHCGFLVSLAPTVRTAADALPRCPRCEGTLDEHPDSDAQAGRSPMDGDASKAGGVDADAVDTATGNAPLDASATAAAAPDEADTGLHGDVPPASTGAPEPRARRATGLRGGPSFARITVSADGDSLRWPMRALVAVLTVMLGLQLMLAQRAELAADARWRPWIQATCDVLGCTLPPWRDPGAFRMLDRDVRGRPDAPGVLQVTASFRNDARWAQAWPTLRVGLTDIEGREVAARAFVPAEYRTAPGGDAADGDALLAPGQSASVRFDVREPEARIVAFTFDFR